MFCGGIIESHRKILLITCSYWMIAQQTLVTLKLLQRMKQRRSCIPALGVCFAQGTNSTHKKYTRHLHNIKENAACCSLCFNMHRPFCSIRRKQPTALPRIYYFVMPANATPHLYEISTPVVVSVVAQNRATIILFQRTVISRFFRRKYTAIYLCYTFVPATTMRHNRQLTPFHHVPQWRLRLK